MKSNIYRYHEIDTEWIVMGTIVDDKPAGPAVGITSHVKGLKSMLACTLTAILRRLEETDCDLPSEGSDPLSHPAIRAMSARELADLPWPTARRK